MHNKPHTATAKAKMRAAHLGKPAPWKYRPLVEVDGCVFYRCGRCGGFFPKDWFYTSKRSSLGIKTDCKKCHTLVSVASRNRDTTRAAGRRNEAVRRARKAGTAGRVTAADVHVLTEILGVACLKCGSGESPTHDHIIPLAKGGIHHPTNLQPLCRSCNEHKQARTADYRSPEQRAAVAARWVIEFRRVAP